MFKTMTKCLTKVDVPLDDIKKISPYIFCKWLSGNIYTVQASNQLNMYYDIPIECQFKLIQQAFGGKIKYIAYPKIENENIKELEYIARFFNINLEKAKEYMSIIDKKELNKIISAYKALEK